MLDLQMLTLLSGKERTEKEYSKMLRTAGFRLDQAIDFGMSTSILESVAVKQDAGLLSAVSKRQPSGGSIGAIIRPRIEGNRRAWGSLTNCVDDDFE